MTTAGSVSYTYDWLGRRVSRTVSGGTTTCVYDGGQIIAEYNGGTLLRKYIYGPGIDEPVCMVASGGTYYYHFDGLGSVAALTDSGGTLVEKYRYDAFGGTTILSPNNQTRTTSLYGNRFMFTGRWWDSTTKLYHYRARDYSPTLGRFLQTDPIGYADSMILYQYCGNNPVNWIDPSGLRRHLWPETQREMQRSRNNYNPYKHRDPYEDPHRGGFDYMGTGHEFVIPLSWLKKRGIDISGWQSGKHSVILTDTQFGNFLAGYAWGREALGYSGVRIAGVANAIQKYANDSEDNPWYYYLDYDGSVRDINRGVQVRQAIVRQ